MTAPAVADLPANMQSKIVVGHGGCWLWTGAVNSNGYGQVGVGGVSKSTHRVAYQLLIGPIPHGLVIDHLCRVRRCCNPTHLEPVTVAVNNQRGEQATKTHCLRGHPLFGGNLLLKITKSGQPRRNCRTCKRAQDKARRRAARYAPKAVA